MPGAVGLLAALANAQQGPPAGERAAPVRPFDPSGYKTVMERGYKPQQAPNIARDGRWLLQLYDKNFTRTEMMVRKPVQKPCCSPNLDDFKQ